MLTEPVEQCPIRRECRGCDAVEVREERGEQPEEDEQGGDRSGDQSGRIPECIEHTSLDGPVLASAEQDVEPLFTGCARFGPCPQYRTTGKQEPNADQGHADDKRVREQFVVEPALLFRGRILPWDLGQQCPLETVPESEHGDKHHSGGQVDRHQRPKRTPQERAPENDHESEHDREHDLVVCEHEREADECRDHPPSLWPLQVAKDRHTEDQRSDGRVRIVPDVSRVVQKRR